MYTTFSFDPNRPSARHDIICEHQTGILHLIESETNEEMDMEILFLFTQLIYTGYYCDGIARIGDTMGIVHIFDGTPESYVQFYPNNALHDKEKYDQAVRNITEAGEDDIRNTEAIRV